MVRQRDVPGTISGRGHSLALKAGGREGGVGSSRLGTSHRIVHMPALVLKFSARTHGRVVRTWDMLAWSIQEMGRRCRAWVWGTPGMV